MKISIRLIVAIALVIVVAAATVIAYNTLIPKQQTITTTTQQPITTPILFGGNLEWTGQEASVNIWKERGVRMFIEEANSKGGVLGRPLDIIIYDSALSSEKATSIATRLIEVDHVNIVLSLGATVTSTAMISVTEAHKVVNFVMFAPASLVRQKLADPKYYPYTFIFSAGSYFYPKAFLDFLASLPEKDRPKTIAVIGRNDVYGKDSYSSIDEWLKGKPGMFQIVANEYFDVGTPDLKPVVAKIIAPKPDVIMANVYMGEAIQIVKALEELRWKPKFFWINVGPQQPEWTQQLGKLGDYVFTSTPYIWSIPTSENQKLNNITLARYGTKAVYGQGTAYAMMEIMVQAIKKAGSTDSDKLVSVLNTAEFDTIIGKVKFTNGVLMLEHFVVQIINGTPEVVWPLQYRTHEPVYPMPGS
jgi:branched-chain amino acid transport system substrate-binding protein